MKISSLLSWPLLLAAHRASAFSAAPRKTLLGASGSASEGRPSPALSFFNRNKAAPELEPVAVPGIGPEGCALPSPSGVNTLDAPVQASIVVSSSV